MAQLPNEMRPLPTDVTYPGNVPISDCVCSRCKQPIDDRTVPIWMWTENVERAWCYHPVCVGIEDTDYYGDEDDLDWDDWMQEAAVEDDNDLTEEEIEELVIEMVCDEEEQLDLGACARSFASWRRPPGEWRF